MPGSGTWLVVNWTAARGRHEVEVFPGFMFARDGSGMPTSVGVSIKEVGGNDVAALEFEPNQLTTFRGNCCVLLSTSARSTHRQISRTTPRMIRRHLNSAHRTCVVTSTRPISNEVSAPGVSRAACRTRNGRRRAAELALQNQVWLPPD